MGSLTVRRLDESARELAARSRNWQAKGRPVLTIGVPKDEAIVLGAFQRPSEIQTSLPILRRGSGGGVASVGPGTVWLQLTLPNLDALMPCPPNRILNRYVRPLLQGLTKAASVKASYFDRDWVSASHRPVALVAFAHETTTNAACFEAIVAVSSEFTPIDRPSFLGKKPATLEEVSGRKLAGSTVVDAVIAAYASLASSTGEATIEPAPPAEIISTDPPWQATREEAIGLIAAGRDATGRLRIGGELMASEDAIARLEQKLEHLPPNATSDEIGRIVDEALTTKGAQTFGVRNLATIRDVLQETLSH